MRGIEREGLETGLNDLDGAEGQNRTVDTSLFRAVLCQLSYLGTSSGRGGVG